MPVLPGRAFLLVFGWQIDLKVIIGAVKKDAAEISLIMLLIAVVKEFNVFFVRCPDKGAAVINLVFRNTVIQMREDRGHRFGF